MSKYHTQVLRRIVMIAAAAALAAPTIATAGGRDQREELVNPILRNDIAHFGNQPSAPISSTTQGPAPVVVRVGGGFDWISAGVGAAGMLGFTVAAIAGLSVLRRRNRVGALSA